MTRRLRLTIHALADLDAIFEFLAVRNSTAAQRYISGLREQCDIYLTNPFMGQMEPEVAERLGEAPESVRSFPHRNHRCYYMVTDEEMRVLGFIDMRQDVDTVIEERFPH
jgi:plasmid stabilization system protein ParE